MYVLMYTLLCLQIRRVLVGAAEDCQLLQSRQRGTVIQTAQAAQQLVSAVCKAAHKVILKPFRTLM